MNHQRMFRHEDAARLDGPERRPGLDEPDPMDWYPVDEVFGRLCVGRGMSVALAGVRARALGIPLVRTVGPRGKVNAISPRAMELAAFRAGLPSNAPLRMIEAEFAKTPLSGSSQDLVFSANVWHEFANPRAVVDEFARILRPDAHLALVEWRPSPALQGPPRDRRVAAREIVELLRSRGWSELADVPIGAHSALVVARRPEIVGRSFAG
jgi:SAM-dependent methyltransferase